MLSHLAQALNFENFYGCAASLPISSFPSSPHLLLPYLLTLPFFICISSHGHSHKVWGALKLPEQVWVEPSCQTTFWAEKCLWWEQF